MIADRELGIAVVVEKRTVADRAELGMVAEIENVAVAVDMGDGNIGFKEQQRVCLIQKLPTTEKQRSPEPSSYVE